MWQLESELPVESGKRVTGWIGLSGAALALRFNANAVMLGAQSVTHLIEQFWGVNSRRGAFWFHIVEYRRFK